MSEARHYGLHPAIVTDVVDPDRLGRVEVRFPWLGAAGDAVRAWATLLSPYADDEQGLFALPAVGTEVVVGFEDGLLTRPYVVGACWNGRAAMPVTPTRPNDKRVFKSRSGAVLEFDDARGAEKVTVRLGGHHLVLDQGTRQVELAHADGSTITLTAGGQVTVRANSTVDLTASCVNVHAPTAVFDGTISCTTLAATSVVATSYTPGAGNIW